MFWANYKFLGNPSFTLLKFMPKANTNSTFFLKEDIIKGNPIKLNCLIYLETIKKKTVLTFNNCKWRFQSHAVISASMRGFTHS